MTQTSTSTRSRLGLALAGLVTAALLAVAPGCAGGREGTPVQGWWDGRGPVVPHDAFPADCSLCHEGDDWQTIRADFRYDHAAETGVALTGAHATAECLRCHNDRGPVATFAARGCAGCHEDPHGSQLGQDCSSCHDDTTWRPNEVYESHARTRFPLTGAHAATACWRCHPGADVGQFTGLDPDCVTCHADDLATTATSATAPDHLVQGWVGDCEQCHFPTSWSGGGFHHPGFPLTGAHNTAACEACHVGGVYGGQPSECFACHEAQFSGAADHVTFGYPTACQFCHDTSDWSGAQFNHHAVGTGNSCDTCHHDDYLAAQPDHVASGFPTTCQACHSTSTWLGAKFDHLAAGITTGCADCHLDEYQATTSPNHQAANFPLACELCHNTTNWNQATFDHSFPLTTGKHKNLDCIDCHTVPSNPGVFSCIDCHEHNQSDMADKHKGDKFQNYVWASAACYQCHPTGKED